MNFQQSFFELFGLAPSFSLDVPTLEQQYRALQLTVHPDKSAYLSEAEQRLAVQQATFVNEAYQTLRSPLRRARYLLKLSGVDTQEETNTAMPVDFLVAQMEWREAIGEAVQARDADVLGTLESRLQTETGELEAQLADRIDAVRDLDGAAGLVRKLRFMEKLAEEIADAYDQIDN